MTFYSNSKQSNLEIQMRLIIFVKSKLLGLKVLDLDMTRQVKQECVPHLMTGVKYSHLPQAAHAQTALTTSVTPSLAVLM